uniref:MOSC domain-containing protein n=1 Tax=Panagrolaimus sp. JU765 TaxID=591449 RepID=A0AC34QUE0_9BILA
MGVLKDGRVVAAVAGVAGVGILTGYLVYRKYREHLYWNSEFVPVGYVKELFVHPIKSTKPIKPQWFECTAKGAKYEENQDRSFLVVDAKLDHLFLTARQYPKLVLIESYVKNNVLTVKTPDGNSVEVDLAEVIKRNDVRRGILFEKKTQDGLDCGDEVAELIANWLNVADKREIRLIYYADGLQTERDFVTDPSYWLNPVPIVPDTPAYQDLASFMLCTEASANELNERLAKLGDDKCTVSIRNFRPNINVAGTIPFDEDRWLNVKIGEAEFTCYKPCTRCVLTTVDPDKGAFNKNMQPLRLLRSYRLAPKGKMLDLYGDSPIFGVNMAATKFGKINIGDQVLVRYKPSPL